MTTRGALLVLCLFCCAVFAFGFWDGRYSGLPAWVAIPIFSGGAFLAVMGNYYVRRWATRRAEERGTDWLHTDAATWTVTDQDYRCRDHRPECPFCHATDDRVYERGRGEGFVRYRCKNCLGEFDL